MPVPLIYFIGIFISTFFAPDLLRRYGVNLGGSDAELLAAVKQLSEENQSRTPVLPSTPNSEPEPDQDPSNRDIVAKAVDKPINWLFLALLAFALIFLIAQVRAGVHELGSAAGDVYDEAKNATNSLANADKSTKNISRRAKG